MNGHELLMQLYCEYLASLGVKMNDALKYEMLTDSKVVRGFSERLKQAYGQDIMSYLGFSKAGELAILLAAEFEHSNKTIDRSLRRLDSKEIEQCKRAIEERLAKSSVIERA